MSHFHTLYHHILHPHQPRNINAVHAQEQQRLNARIAVVLTRVVGSMPTAYTFTLLAVIGLLGILGLLNPLTIILVAWMSQTLIQLVLLPVIMVGQNVLGRKSELQADEMYDFSVKSFHDIEQIMLHLDKQDEAILEILERLEKGQKSA